MIPLVTVLPWMGMSSFGEGLAQAPQAHTVSIALSTTPSKEVLLPL